MRKVLVSLLAASALALTLAGCSAANEDRGSGAGKSPDSVQDTSHVELYRNADDIPNVAYFCAGELGWASTLSGGTSDGYKAPQLVRLPEYDEVCGGQEATPR